jgi:DNA-binding beta-propeller fold protein YncE
MARISSAIAAPKINLIFNGQLNVPRDLVVDPGGDIYVTDSNNHSVHVFAPAWRHTDNLDLFWAV